MRPTPPLRSATPQKAPTPAMHTVELVLPIKVVNDLKAKGGSLDQALHDALTAYLRTDIAARNARIKEFVALGRDVEKLAEFHGMPPEDIMKIAKS